MLRTAILALMALMVMGCMAKAQEVQTSPAYQHAVYLETSGQFHHDASAVAEVIYKAPTQATPAMAQAAWMNSPPHRALIVSGQITDIQCYGGTCVGRGYSYYAYSYPQATYQQPVQRRGLFGGLFRRCR